MSPTKSKSHPSPRKPSAQIPVVNVFDEDPQTPQAVTPARKPIVVEIEDVPPAEPQLPPPMEVSVEPQSQAPMEAPVQPPVQPMPQVQYAPVAQPQEVVQAAPVIQQDLPQAPQVQVPTYQPPAQSNVAQVGGEPVLPSFFEHDLKGTAAPAQPEFQAPTVESTPQPFAQPQPVTPFQPQALADGGVPPMDGALPQAVIGEINEASGGDDKRKLIGIVLIVVALIVLLAGILVVYAKKLSSPTVVPTPTPMLTQPTMAPTPVPTATPVASGSGSLVATDSAEFADMKKKIKVDVLNGTKISGLASKQAALLKAAGYTTGRVGNGDAEAAGTIVVPTGHTPIAKDIQNILKDMTFTVTEDKKATAVVVTLGEPKG